MTTLILTIVPFAVVIAGFLLLRVWLVKQPDRPKARHHGLGVFIWIIASLILAALVLRFVAPGSTPTGPLACLMAFLLVFAIWQRRRISLQLHEK
jgi:amino acid transporter